MTQTRPETKESIGIIRGSTAKIWVQLYRLAANLPEQTSDKVIRQCTALDVIAAQTLNRIAAAPNRLEYTEGAINAGLVQLKTVNTKESTLLHTQYSTQFETNKTKITKLLADRESLLRQYQELVQKQNQTIRELIDKLLKGEISESDLLGQLKDLKQVFKKFATGVNRYVQDLNNLQQTMDTLHTNVYLVVPADKKGGIPPPVQEEPTIRPH